MKNKIRVESWCTMYSLIYVTKNRVTSKHVVANNGWFPLEYWTDYFENKF